VITVKFVIITAIEEPVIFNDEIAFDTIASLDTCRSQLDQRSELDPKRYICTWPCHGCCRTGRPAQEASTYLLL